MPTRKTMNSFLDELASVISRAGRGKRCARWQALSAPH